MRTSFAERVVRLFLAFLVVLAGYFSIDALLKLERYHAFSRSTNVVNLAWEIIPKQLWSEKYEIVAHYWYNVDGVTYSGITRYDELSFWNDEAAQFYIKNQLEKSAVVHFSPRSPGKSTMNHVYPWKAVVYAMVLVIAVASLLRVFFKLSEGESPL